MRIDIRFSSGMILHNYEVKDVIATDNWLMITEETGAITYANLNNIDIYTLYEEAIPKGERDEHI